MKTHKLTYEISERQFMQAVRVLWAHRAIGSTGNLIAGGLLTAGSIFMLWQGVPGIIPWLLLGGGIAVIALNTLRDRRWLHYYRENPKFGAPITARLSQEGVGVTSAEGDNDLRWTHFKHHAVLGDTLYLIVDAQQFSIIPLAACKDIQARAALIELVKSKLKPLPRRML